MSIVFTFALAHAQTDTTKVEITPTNQTKSNSYTSTKIVEDPSKDMIKIPMTQVPETLKVTLQEDQYKDWEKNGIVYQNPGTSEFALKISVVSNSANTTLPTWYYFDGNGKRISQPQD